MNEMFYSLKAVCRLTGLRATTLHAWEKRYGAVKPVRTETNHRVYSQEDVERLRMLVTARDLGHSISHIACLSMEQLRGVVSEPAERTSEILDGRDQRSHRPASASFCRRTLLAVDQYDLDRVHDELALARNRFETTVFVLEIVVPLCEHMGKLVARDKLSIVRQHALSTIIEANVFTEGLRLRLMHQRRPGKLSTGVKRFTLTTFDGDYHELGILLASVLCINQGFIVHNLGPSTPAQALAEAAIAMRSDIIVLACPKILAEAMPQDPREYMQDLCAHLPRLCEIWLGGEDAFGLMHLGLTRRILHFKTLHDLYRHLLELSVPT